MKIKKYLIRQAADEVLLEPRLDVVAQMANVLGRERVQHPVQSEFARRAVPGLNFSYF